MTNSFGTLPIEFDGFTVFYIFFLAFSFFFMRVSLSWKDRRNWPGVVFFAYIWLVSLYYIARSHPNNVRNISTWALLIMVVSAPKLLSPQLAWLHRVSISLVCALSLNYAISHATDENTARLWDRVKAPEWWRGPELPGIGDPVKSFIEANPHVTYVLQNYMGKPTKSGLHSGNSSGLSPLDAFLILPEARRCEYLNRMSKSRGGVTVVTHPDADQNFRAMLKSCAAVVTWHEEPSMSVFKVYRLE